ncbi:oligosaccharide flippase family protein [Hungatella hathewayi]|uniref:oligosaccharide flippase family protein n=1 Tax=Hungatella hathewayi TaxID=154046 RepID=UPI0035641439
MASYKKLGKDIILMTIGSFGSKLISFFFVPFYTAVLTTEEYGISDLVTTTVTLLFPFFSAIICEAMMRFALERDNEPKEVWKVGCRITIIGIIVFLLVSPSILFTIFKPYYKYIVAYFVTYTIHSNISYFIRGINKVKIFAISGIFQTFCIVIFNFIFLLWLKLGIRGYLSALIVATMFSIIYMVLWSGIYKFGCDIVHVDKELQKGMLKYSLPMIPNSISWWIANVSDRYILTAFCGVAATGVYAVAYKIPTIITTLSSIFGRAWKLSAVDNFGSIESKKFFEDVFSKLSALLVLSASALMLLNKPLSSILYRKEFYQAWQFVPVLVMAAVVHAYIEFIGAIYTSAYKTKFLVISTGLGAGINIVFNFLLIPFYGAMGAAIATLIGYLVTWISRSIDSRKIMKLQYKLKRDVVCYIFVTIQILVATKGGRYEFSISLVIFFCILFMMFGEIKHVFCMALKNIRR